MKPNRERSGEKIDGVVDVAMAIRLILVRQPEPYLDIRIFSEAIPFGYRSFSATLDV